MLESLNEEDYNFVNDLVNSMNSQFDYSMTHREGLVLLQLQKDFVELFKSIDPKNRMTKDQIKEFVESNFVEKLIQRLQRNETILKMLRDDEDLRNKFLDMVFSK